MTLKSHVLKVLSEISSLWEIPLRLFDKLKNLSISEEFHKLAIEIVNKYDSLYRILYDESELFLGGIFAVRNVTGCYPEYECPFERQLVFRHSILECYLKGEVPNVSLILAERN